MSEAITVDGLPDFPAIEQVNKALWQVGRTRGAAVLVGAGFSRNAERIHEGTPLPPDWRALSRVDYVGAHCLRHACATRLLRKGASLQQIADFLGHRNVRSVDTYARLDMRSLRKVAAFSFSELT